MNLKYLDTPDKVKRYVEGFKLPNFTIKELRSSIPTELFKKSLIKSSYYLLKDVFIIAILYILSINIKHYSSPIQLVLWPIYWILQGMFGFGLWVIAHECGHQAFSNSKQINDTVGFILHSFLLVPYHSWRISHSMHHAHTGNLDKDQAFVPYKKEDYKWPIPESPIFSLIKIFQYLILGWPAYLFLNKSGQEHTEWVSHFKPTSSIFKAHQRHLIVFSDVGVLLTVLGLALWVYYAGLWAMTKYYFIPYLHVNAWLIMVTLLQHTDVYLPHYEDDEKWNFVRGALATVDRDFGWFINDALNHINDSHITHHLFSQMPHYNAIKATPYLKEALGDYYLYDDTWFPVALYNVAKNCNYVDHKSGLLFYEH